MLADLVPCISIVSVLLVIFGFIGFLRYLSYRETIALAEKGLTRPEQANNNKGVLRWGILVTALGLALSLGLYFAGFGSAESYPLHLGPWMLGGFVPLFLGLSLLLIHLLTQKDDVTPKDD
jgi:sterol desaturase/sphingolipid hydroxylase (fatty acid hydroxylase superfamily)